MFTDDTLAPDPFSLNLNTSTSSAGGPEDETRATTDPACFRSFIELEIGSLPPTPFVLSLFLIFVPWDADDLLPFLDDFASIGAPAPSSLKVKKKGGG